MLARREITNEERAASDRPEDSERTCVGCRRRDARDALLRVVIQGDVLPDVQRRMPGRGFSIHPTRACIARALSASALRAAKTAPEDLCARAAEQYRRRAQGLLLAASRKRAVALGTEAVMRAIDDGGAALVVFAADAAGRREDIVRAADARGIACRQHGDKAELGRLFGRPELGVLAILDRGIATEVDVAAARATELSEAQ